MTTKEPNSFCIYESRIATMVSSESQEGEVESTQRLANFLKPCAKSLPTLHSETVSQKVQEKKNHPPHPHPHPKLHFKGWKNPQNKWGDWVESLTAEHALTWDQTGICDAVLSSLHEFPRNPSLILALVEHWCPNTNTFVFPWGEATITLEDIMILGGFSVLGEPITLPLSYKMLSMESQLVELRRRMWKSKSKKPDQQSWLKLFKEQLVESNELEHVGFLSLWLSRFVFPSLSDSTTIGTRVFPIAIHLSQGTRMALAPAVLASIYHNLSLLKEKLEVSSVKDTVTVMGPFQLVQLWAFERFPILVGSNCPRELKLGEPRAARWHKINSNASFLSILSALKSVENFQWRPYVVELKNWCFVSHYKDNEQLVVDGLNSAEGLRSFGVCLCADELVGLDCVVEKYMPYRVAMQFGMDQDLPGEFTVMCPSFKGNFSFFVPARCYKPCVSLEYFNWWQKSKVIQGENVLKPERNVDDSNLLCDKICMLDVLMIAKEYCEEESHASTASTENNSKRKLSTKEENKDKEVESNQEGETKKKALKNNGPSFFSGLLSAEGKLQHGAGTCDNPLEVEDYVCATLGTLSHPINIDNYM